MRILFDQATPVPIRAFLKGHTVRTAAQEGWDKLSNGELLIAAEVAGFDALLTTDKNLVYLLAGRSRSLYLASSNGRTFVHMYSSSWWPLTPFHPAAILKLKFLIISHPVARRASTFPHAIVSKGGYDPFRVR